jgi:hypothetical protein
MSTLKVKKVKTSLKLSKMTFLQLVDFAKHVVASMTGNAHFVAPLPLLATISTAIASLEAAIVASKPSTPTATADKHAKRKVLYDAMTHLGAYVEGIANMDPPNAVTIVTSAGMEVKLPGKPRPAGFRLQLTGKPGEVRLLTTSVKAAAYKWQYTPTPTDINSWVTVESSLAKLLLTGLTSVTRYYFRVAVIGHTTGAWSTVINAVIA